MIDQARVDGELRQAFLALTSHDFGDLSAARLRSLSRQLPVNRRRMPRNVQFSEAFVQSGDGFPIPVRCYARADRTPQGVLVWAHGGGYVLGQAQQDDVMLRALCRDTGCLVVAPDYRLAPEYPFPTPFEDFLSVVQWSRGLGAAPEQGTLPLILAGSSAGAGLAAAASLWAAAGGGIEITLQVLSAPMLDDRTSAGRALHDDPHVWSGVHNAFAWSAYLGDTVGTATVSPFAAPARARELQRVASTFIAVGDLDLFAREDVRYALDLMEAGVPVELHMYPGAFHGFAAAAPHAALSRRFVDDRNRAIRAALAGAAR